MALCFADFEFTCGGNITGDKVELLSIGLVITDDSAQAVLDTFYDTVRPIRHSRLTKQCRKLTGLTQSIIDASFDAHYVCRKANQLLDKYGIDKIFVWGNYDVVGLTSTVGNYERLSLDTEPIEKTSAAVTNVQEAVMSRFGTKDIINVKDLSSALDFVPDGSFHNALVDAQALQCIYSHSLRPDTGCEKVYALLNERLEIKKQREEEQRKAFEERTKAVVEAMSENERALYDSLVKKGNKRGAALLIKLHSKIEEGYKKLPEGCDIVALNFKSSEKHAAIKLVEKPKFKLPADSEISFKSYHYEDKEKMIIESFESRTKTHTAKLHRKKRIRT